MAQRFSPRIFTFAYLLTQKSSQPVNDNDPFVTRRLPIAALGARLGGQNGKMSRQLTLLTQGGKMKPSIEEALDSKNLPFIEYCRKAKADDFGVIRIKNVSTPNPRVSTIMK